MASASLVVFAISPLLRNGGVDALVDAVAIAISITIADKNKSTAEKILYNRKIPISLTN